MSNKSDSFGDRIKGYEKRETGRRFMPLLPIVVRLDGKNFSKFTSKMRRPYDPGMSRAMQILTRDLVEYTNARIGYTQSDEITLILYSDDPKSQVFFDGKIFKITSVLASYASIRLERIFATMDPRQAPTRTDQMPLFDCRAFQVPNLTEATNAVLWQEKDATKNAISMAARVFYSHAQLMNKSGAQMQEMLYQKGINFNEYPAYFKRGTYVQRRRVLKELDAETLARIPEGKRPDGPIERWELQFLDLPPLGAVANRVAVIFDGSDPIPMDNIEPSLLPDKYLQAVIEMVQEWAPDEEDGENLTAETSFGQLSSFDWLSFTEVVMSLEDRFEIRLPYGVDGDYSVITLRELADSLREQVEGK